MTVDAAPDWVAAGTPGPLKDELVSLLGADRVLTRAIDLIKYASDASPYRLIPKAVAVPHDATEVAALIFGNPRGEASHPTTPEALVALSRRAGVPLWIPEDVGRVVVHPTCASMHLGISGKLTAVAEAMADEVVIPAATGCCGMAGDRGWLHPELPAAALRDVAAELDGQSFDAYLSSNRTCEAALRDVTGRSYTSFVLALEALTRQ